MKLPNKSNLYNFLFKNDVKKLKSGYTFYTSSRNPVSVYYLDDNKYEIIITKLDYSSTIGLSKSLMVKQKSSAPTREEVYDTSIMLSTLNYARLEQRPNYAKLLLNIDGENEMIARDENNFYLRFNVNKIGLITNTGETDYYIEKKFNFGSKKPYSELLISKRQDSFYLILLSSTEFSAVNSPDILKTILK
ncbi:hypothetical protein [Pedobacter jeongneungensis]|uniref:hypothetical protein n=1 Tax=Pedobacter jeongneungensis TaxID=947309 RepID=UPI0013B419B2|nr:hypothetical protein [Pedobacter jeongneungensis]